MPLECMGTSAVQWVRLLCEALFTAACEHTMNVMCCVAVVFVGKRTQPPSAAAATEHSLVGSHVSFQLVTTMASKLDYGRQARTASCGGSLKGNYFPAHLYTVVWPKIR